MKTNLNFKTIFLLTLLITTFQVHANFDDLVGKKKIELGASEKDADIYINGKLVGKGSTVVTVPKDDCVTVIVKKTAYLTERIEFCNKKLYRIM